jgi:lactoylglutathione lyase
VYAPQLEDEPAAFPCRRRGPAIYPAANPRNITRKGSAMRYLHTMVRVTDVDQSLDFYCNKMGMREVRRIESEQGRFTLIFLAASEDEATGRSEHAPLVELTYNWDPEEYTGGRNFGHLAYEVDDIYELCQSLMDKGVTINRPPRDGRMAFVRSPDGISIELLQKGPAKEKAEPWASMPNTGSW